MRHESNYFINEESKFSLDNCMLEHFFMLEINDIGISNVELWRL